MNARSTSRTAEFAPGLREAYREALESDLRDLDPKTLELLGFTLDATTGEGLTHQLEQAPELPS